MALCIVALAGPRFANDRTETEASGVDIMLVLDLSWSMMALDMGAPEERVSRFDIASEVLEDFIRKRPSDRIGLVVFSAVPYLASPLTLNHDWLIENLQRLHVGLIRDLGTAIGDATAAGAKRLEGPQGQQEPHHHPADRRRQQQGRDRSGARRAACRRAGREDLHHRHRHRAALQVAGVRPGDRQAQTLMPTATSSPAWPCSRRTTLCSARWPRSRAAKFYRATNRRELQRIYDEIDRLEKTEVKLRRFTTYRPLVPMAVAGGVRAVRPGAGSGQHPAQEGAVMGSLASEVRDPNIHGRRTGSRRAAL